MPTIVRLMVMTHHNAWLIVAISVVAVAGLLLGLRTKNTIGRIPVLTIALSAWVFIGATGAAIAPLDDWQHQHGSCLLDILEKTRR